MQILRIKNNTRLVVSSLVLFIVFSWLYQHVITGLVSEWYGNPDHSHGFIIPFIAGYFIWQRIERIRKVELAPTNWGIIILLSGLIMYILGDMGAAYTTSRVSMLIALTGIIIFVYGISLFKNLYLPFFMLFFMIPLPRYLYDAVAFPLKLFVTKYSVSILNSMGILVYREGNIIMLENVTLQVVEACSGIRSLTSILVVGVTLAFISQLTAIKRIVLILAAVPIAISANIARIVITGILARNYGNGVAEGFYHEFAGLAVFGVEILLLGIVAVLLNISRNKIV